MDRKIVKAAQDGGRIWSPEHGRFLPAEGMEVQMTPFWLHLLERKDIVANDVPEPEPEAEATEAKPTTADTKPPAQAPAAKPLPAKATPAA